MNRRDMATIGLVGALVLVVAWQYTNQSRTGHSAGGVNPTGHTDRGGARMLLETKVSPDCYAARRYGFMAEPYEMDDHIFGRAHPLSAHVAMIAPNMRILAEHGWGYAASPPSEETI